MHFTRERKGQGKQKKAAKERVKAKEMRLKSLRKATQKLAETPYLFEEIRHVEQPYLLIPIVSSETRKFIPIGYLSADVICSNASFMLPNASLYNFGLLCSTFHNAWMRTVCGRLKSDYRYSNTVVYNNFPFPENLKSAQIKKIETAAQQILDARKAEEDLCAKQNQKCSLAMLYAKEGMPANLVKAHNALDKVVDAAYGYKERRGQVLHFAYEKEKGSSLERRRKGQVLHCVRGMEEKERRGQVLHFALPPQLGKLFS